MQYDVTICDEHIVIGCEIKTIAEWMAVTEHEAIEMGLRRENYPQFKAIVEMVDKVREGR